MFVFLVILLILAIYAAISVVVMAYRTATMKEYSKWEQREKSEEEEWIVVSSIFWLIFGVARLLVYPFVKLYDFTFNTTRKWKIGKRKAS